MFVAANICRDKGFDATNIILSRQNFSYDKRTFVATKDVFCRDKHVATKMILVAALASNSLLRAVTYSIRFA